MTDINYIQDPTEVSEQEKNDRLFEVVELLFFAYRDFTSDPDEILGEIGFGRAHHRVIHFIARNPGIKVADLLDILRITKQSLGRVLKQLIESGYVYQREGPKDRRQRLLYLTEKGDDLARRLAAPQFERIREALQIAGPEAEDAFRKVLIQLINRQDRENVERIALRKN